jgi:DNA-binding response OmpR family regulator
LPEESGIDLCPKIRALPGYEKTPVVFVTARDTVDNRTQSTVGGGNDFITKPFNTLELTLKAQIWITVNSSDCCKS